MRQSENTVFIEGILSEIDLKYGSFPKNGVDTKSITGSIKVKVTQDINKVPTVLEIPVHMFATEMTNAGKKNPAFESIERVMNEYVSIAAAGEDAADRIRITKGQIKQNEYWATPETLVSYPRVNASFVQKIKKDECTPKATFNVDFMVASNTAEVDRDGVETGRQVVKGIVAQYGGKVDVVQFIAAAPGVKDAVSQYWNKGDTVKATGRLNFSSKTETILEDVDFGEPIEKSRTINVSELIITGGSQTPLEGDFAFDVNEINAALTQRTADLDARKAKDVSRTKQASAPAPEINDLGF